MLEFFKRKWKAEALSHDMREDKRVSAIKCALGLTDLSAQLLVNRGYQTPEEARVFLEKRSEMLHDPFLMKNIEKGARRLIESAKNGERIVIYGDYDVDGVTSVSILFTYLKKLGAHVSYYIPSRTGEGYGMSVSAIDRIKEDGVDLIVTVDTGITAIEEAEYIRKIGIDLIITDHHECHTQIPVAQAVINPRQPDCKYPFKELAGVGVVFKLLCAMEKCTHEEDSLRDCVKRVSAEYADLVAVGTVADVMPVKDENRLIVSLGLRMMEESPRLAISELLSAVNADNAKYKQKKKITSGVIGYTIAPRINAAGRIKNASIAVDLFLAQDREEVARLANELCEINRERQAEENKIIDAAYEKIEKEHDFENDKVIVLSDESWHHGVIGIVASRITEKYKCPSILVSFNGEDNDGESHDCGKGSGRSIKGMNLVEALTFCSDLLVKYGGHELAAGLTVKREDLPAFKKRINEYADKCFANEGASSFVSADIELEPDDISMVAAKELFHFEPFGVSNPVPVFIMRGVHVDSVSNVGAGKHEKLILSKDNTTFQAMYFRHSVAETDIYENDTVDIMFNLDINNFQGKETLQFIIKDMTLSENQLTEECNARMTAASILDGSYDFSSATPEDVINTVPTREEFGVVYNLLRRELRMEHDVFSIRALSKLIEDAGHDFTYIKLKLIIKVFQELNLLSVDEIDAQRELYKFKYVYIKNKTDLDRSGLYRKIKQNFGIKGN